MARNPIRLTLAETAPAGLPLRILCIDDQPAVIAPLVKYLRQRGCRIDVMHDAPSGLEAVARRAHDVIVLDWRMPGRGGMQVLDDLKPLEIAAPVIMLSGYATLDLAVEAGHRGARAMKTKPISGSDLLATIRHVTGRAHKGGLPGVEDPSWRLLARVFFGEALEELAGRRGRMLAEHWRALLTKYVQLLAESGITIVETRNGVEALRRLIVARDTDWPAGEALAIARSIATAEPPFVFGLLRDKVQIGVMRFESGGPAETQLLEAAFVRDLHIDPSHYGRLLTTSTTLKYEDWQSGARMRQAIAALVHTADQISEIATACGWPSLKSMERQFKETPGISPTELRTLVW